MESSWGRGVVDSGNVGNPYFRGRYVAWDRLLIAPLLDGAGWLTNVLLHPAANLWYVTYLPADSPFELSTYHLTLSPTRPRFPYGFRVPPDLHS